MSRYTTLAERQAYVKKFTARVKKAQKAYKAMLENRAAYTLAERNKISSAWREAVKVSNDYYCAGIMHEDN